MADRIVIDMGAITREMYRKYVPEGGAQNLTPEQRQQMARDIARKVESDVTYPGQIRITVVRESRSQGVIAGVSGGGERSSTPRP